MEGQTLSTPRASRRQPGSGQSRQPRPLPDGDTLFTPDASPARASIEQRSAVPLLWLHQLPRWLPPAVAVVGLVIGLAVAGWVGAIALVALAAALGWLAAMSWPRLNPRGRALRVIVIALVLTVAVVRGLHG